MPRYPGVTANKLQRDRSLIAALLVGAVPLHLESTSANFKPVPWRYTPDLSRVGNCTVCANQDAWRKAASTADLAPVGQPNLLIDEAPLSDWRGVVLVLSPLAPRPSPMALAPCPSLLTPRPSRLTPHPSLLTLPNRSPLAPRPSPLTPHP